MERFSSPDQAAGEIIFFFQSSKRFFLSKFYSILTQLMTLLQYLWPFFLFFTLYSVRFKYHIEVIEDCKLNEQVLIEFSGEF